MELAAFDEEDKQQNLQQEQETLVSFFSFQMFIQTFQLTLKKSLKQTNQNHF